uniref:NADH-ubiquinone oxidoreductase chain 4 n=1 Tax=Echyridella menziesii TaxID=981778 RepID=A0A1X9JP83_9BIVA|nr:NADH dehydrogenase subunit 4 [Echyridella menziesii]AQT38534.1 NADH dehydrogenase subunit 4 [Echyridella menziesii]
MFSLSFVSLMLLGLGLMGLRVFWWGFVWGSMFMTVVSVLIWYSSLDLFNCFGWFFTLDNLSVSLVSLSAMVCGLSVLGSVRDVLKVSNKVGLFVVGNWVLMVALFYCFSFGSLFSFYLFFEVSLIPILLIIIGWGYQPERLQAGKYMMLYTVGASLPLLILIMKYLSNNGMMFIGLVNNGSWSFSWLVLVCGSLAFLVKLPVYGFHLWLPKAHVEAPVAGSMVLAGVLLKLGGYGLVRVFKLLSFSSCASLTLILCLGLVGGVVSSMVCFSQVDVKSLVAYSSVGHMSLVFGGVYSGVEWGLSGALCMMVAHGLCSAGMFFLASEAYKFYYTRSLYLVKGGLVIMPGVSLCWFLMCVINMAAPPSLNLWSELMLVISVLSYSSLFMLLCGGMTFLAGVYSLYLYSVTQHGQYPGWVRGMVWVEEYLNYMVCLGFLVPLVLIVFVLMSFLYFFIF